MSRLLCCRRHRARQDMGAALSLSHPLEGEASDGADGLAAPPTMADVIRERKKKAGGAGLGTLRRRIAAAARRPRDSRPDRGCEHARFIRSVVSSWRLAEVFLLCEELEAGAALRDLVTQAELAREPAPALPAALHAQARDRRWCDVQLAGAGWALPAHRALLAARCTYFRELLRRYPSGPCLVPLDGACAGISRAECEALLAALYAGGDASHERHCERGFSPDADLDIINVDSGGLCSCSLRAARGARRLAERLGARLDELHQDMRYLLDSGECADAWLSFPAEGGAQFGFRALELPCHRVVLAARSRFFRSVVSLAAGGAVCVDERVLPRRFARALLHAAYTDQVIATEVMLHMFQVDLTLIGRDPGSPNNTSCSTSGWAGVGRGAARAPSAAMLGDAFQLYEIARFLEMPIVAQGCEDAILAALSADSLPLVLRWTSTPVASQWVHRQAMRFLRDEFPAVTASAAAARLPRAALAAALASPFTQCSEPQALRAVLRLAGAKQPECAPGWGGRTPRGGRGSGAEPALCPALLALAAHVRTEHLGGAARAAAVRRGLAPAAPPERAADAWLGRGAHRPPRCFLPYLDELKALLEDQPVPEAEIARIRHARYLHRIPDTLYMVAAARLGPGAHAPGAALGAEAACVPPRLRAALRARARELRAAPPARRAQALPASDAQAVRTQIALRAVRELSLPDSCAELLLAEPESDTEPGDSERGWESPRTESSEPWAEADCCRSGGGALRCSAAALRVRTPDRAGTCRREGAAPGAAHHSGSRAAGLAPGSAADGLSARVPDVAMAPNGNTHLLTHRDYCRPAHKEYGGGVLQLDLGDGATHTPRPGSRAQRAAGATRQPRDPSQPSAEDELRAAIEMSVMRAYSSFGCRARAAPPHGAGAASRGSPSPSNSAHLSAARPPPPLQPPFQPPLQHHHHPPHQHLSRAGSATLGGVGVGGGSPSPSPAPSPSPRRARALYRPPHPTQDYRAEGAFGRSAGPPA